MQIHQAVLRLESQLVEELVDPDLGLGVQRVHRPAFQLHVGIARLCVGLKQC